MRAVVQRVSTAKVECGGKVVGQIGTGLMALVGIEVGDGEKDIAYIAKKLIELRVFQDDEEKMNRSVADIGGALLVISQFTLLGQTRKGRRPSFVAAERPERAEPLFAQLLALLRASGLPVETGVFGGDMLVTLANDGPVTLLLESREG